MKNCKNTLEALISGWTFCNVSRILENIKSKYERFQYQTATQWWVVGEITTVLARVFPHRAERISHM